MKPHWHRRIHLIAHGQEATLPDQGVRDRAPDEDSALAMVRLAVTQTIAEQLRGHATHILVDESGPGGYRLTWIDAAGQTNERLIYAVECDQTHGQAVPNVA
jgi:hypothetical protein